VNFDDNDGILDYSKASGKHNYWFFSAPIAA
jgi:hypothetical protein